MAGDGLVCAVHLPRLQRGDAPGHVQYQEHPQPVEIRTTGLEIVWVSIKGVTDVLLPLAEHPRTRPDQARGVPGVDRLQRFIMGDAMVRLFLGQAFGHVLGVNLHVVRRQVGQKRRCGVAQGDLHRMVVNRLEGAVFHEVVQQAGTGAQHAFFHLSHRDAIQRKHDVFRRYRMSVGECSIRVQLENVPEFAGLFIRFPAHCQVANDFAGIDRVVLQNLIESGSRRDEDCIH